MMCDFDAGVQLVSGSEIIPRDGNRTRLGHTDPFRRVLQPPPQSIDFAPEIPPGWGGVRSGASTYLYTFNTGMWHGRTPGKTRVKIDHSRIISFFDPALSSLIEARAGKPRDQFRLDGISEADSQYVQDQIFTREG